MAHDNVYLGLAHGRCHWPGSSSVVLIHKSSHSRFKPQGTGLIWDIQKGSWQELLMSPKVPFRYFCMLCFFHIPLATVSTVAKTQINELVL